MANKIALAIADELERNRFLSLFKIISPRLSRHWLVSAIDEADFIVTDQAHDSPEVDHYRVSHPQSRVVVYAETAPPEGTLHIPKPVRASGLIGFLNQIYGPALKPIPFVRKEHNDAFFAPAYLLACIRLNRFSSAWHLDKSPVFAHCYEKNKVLVHRNLFNLLFEKDVALVNKCVQSGIRCHFQSIETLWETEDFFTCSVYQFTWMCYLTLSHGVLHRDITADTAVRLLRWPEFTRLVHSPKDLVLTAALTKRPFTVNQLVEETRIDWRRVVGFVNACHAIGQLKIVRTGTTDYDAAFRKAESKARRGGTSELIGKIMRRLTGAA